MFVTSKELLASNDLLSSKDRKRHPKNEFQAYAYKLAHDLNDLEHLKIYMRLAKSIDRSVMEHAYSFVADSNSNEKGRLFLWKLKKLREEISRKRDKDNFEYSFVLKKNKELRKIFSDELISKSDNDFEDELRNFISTDATEFKRVLLIGNTSIKLIVALLSVGAKVVDMEISSEVATKVKVQLLNRLTKQKSKVVTKDFLLNKFEDGFFDAVIINNYWNFVPFSAESKFLNECKRVLAVNGKLIINTKINNFAEESWNILNHKVKELWIYQKKITKKNIVEKAQEIGFSLFDMLTRAGDLLTFKFIKE